MKKKSEDTTIGVSRTIKAQLEATKGGRNWSEFLAELAEIAKYVSLEDLAAAKAAAGPSVSVGQIVRRGINNAAARIETSKERNGHASKAHGKILAFVEEYRSGKNAEIDPRLIVTKAIIRRPKTAGGPGCGLKTANTFFESPDAAKIVAAQCEAAGIEATQSAINAHNLAIGIENRGA